MSTTTANDACTGCGWRCEYPESHATWAMQDGCDWMQARYYMSITEDGEVEMSPRYEYAQRMATKLRRFKTEANAWDHKLNYCAGQHQRKAHAADLRNQLRNDEELRDELNWSNVPDNKLLAELTRLRTKYDQICADACQALVDHPHREEQFYIDRDLTATCNLCVKHVDEKILSTDLNSLRIDEVQLELDSLEEFSEDLDTQIQRLTEARDKVRQRHTTLIKMFAA